MKSLFTLKSHLITQLFNINGMYGVWMAAIIKKLLQFIRLEYELGINVFSAVMDQSAYITETNSAFMREVKFDHLLL